MRAAGRIGERYLRTLSPPCFSKHHHTPTLGACSQLVHPQAICAKYPGRSLVHNPPATASRRSVGTSPGVLVLRLRVFATQWRPMRVVSARRWVSNANQYRVRPSTFSRRPTLKRALQIDPSVESESLRQGDLSAPTTPSQLRRTATSYDPANRGNIPPRPQPASLLLSMDDLTRYYSSPTASCISSFLIPVNVC